MKRTNLLLAAALVLAVVIIIAQAVTATTPGSESLSRYEREHLSELEDQTRAIEELTRQVRRIADEMR